MNQIPPPQDPQYSAADCQYIGFIGIILADHYCLALSIASRKGYQFTIETLYSWALEFCAEYGFSFQGKWEDLQIAVTIWGDNRLKRFQKERK